MASKKNKILQGDVWLFDPDPTKGHEQGYGPRPCVIMSHDDFNNGAGEMSIIVPCTTTSRKIPCHIKIPPPEGGVQRISFAMSEQIRSISHVRLKKKLGSVSEPTLKSIQDWISDLLDL